MAWGWIRRLMAPGTDPAAPLPDDADDGIRLRFADPTEERRRRVLILMLAVAPDDVGRMLDLAVASLRHRGDLPVFVVSSLDFAPLRQRGLMFEHLPEAASLLADDPGAYARYLRRRLAIIRLKWDPAAELVVGQPFEDFLAANMAMAARADGGSAVDGMAERPVRP